jgi:predicted phage terminase large subunit-like protein
MLLNGPLDRRLDLGGRHADDCSSGRLGEAAKIRLGNVVPITDALLGCEDSNECGIICAGLGADGRGYVLDDVSGVMAPHEWAMTAISLLRERMGDRIIAETNNGGEMVEHTLRMVDPSIPFSAVWASRGKVTRAEPINALYEQGRVHHVGAFPRLEDQMCAFTVDFNRAEMGYSPDRVDALVWALTELMIEATSERRFLFA